MGLNPADVPAFPKIQAIVRDNGTGEVVVAGNSRAVKTAESLQQLRENALAIVVREAQTFDRPVRVQIEDPEGHGELIVTPDGNKESVGYPPRQHAAVPNLQWRRPPRPPTLKRLSWHRAGPTSPLMFVLSRSVKSRPPHPYRQEQP